MSVDNIQYIKKISPKNLGLDKKTIRTMCEKEACSLFSVYGITHDIKVGETDMGEYTKFIGEFEVVSHVTGEIFRSTQLFLPESVSELLESQIRQNKGDSEFKGIQFAYEIGAEHSTKSATEYEYTVNNLMPASENDLLSQMRNRFINPQITA